MWVELFCIITFPTLDVARLYCCISDLKDIFFFFLKDKRQRILFVSKAKLVLGCREQRKKSLRNKSD